MTLNNDGVTPSRNLTPSKTLFLKGLAYGTYMVRLQFFFSILSKIFNFCKISEKLKKWTRRAICYRLVQVSCFWVSSCADSSGFTSIHRHPSSIIFIHHHRSSSSSIITHHHPSSSSIIIVHHHASSVIHHHHHPSSSIIIHHHPSSHMQRLRGAKSCNGFRGLNLAQPICSRGIHLPALKL